MMKLGVADYGMNVWYGGLFDYEQRMLDLKALGYNGLERLPALTEADAVDTAAMLRRIGMDCATVNAPNIEKSIKWSAALGKEYVWTTVSARNFDDYCRQANAQVTAAARYGVKVAIHNHMGSLVETQEQLEEYLKRVSGGYLLLDTGHLAVAGGDVTMIAEKYYDRLAAVHVKTWVATDKNAKAWNERGYFSALNVEDTSPDAIHTPNDEVIRLLRKRGYDKWLLVEHDTHLREPLEDLKDSIDWIRAL